MERNRTASCLTNEDLSNCKPEGYYERKMAAMKAGAVVWMRRTFEGDGGKCFDLYQGQRLLGYVNSEYDNPWRPAVGFTAVAYVMGETGPELLDPEADETNPTVLAVAAFHLEQYCRRTGVIVEE